MSFNLSDYIQSPINAVISNANFMLFSQIGSQIIQLFGVIDAIPDETHQIAVGVSTYPIETGATLMDHAYIKPTQLTLTGYISSVLVSKITTLVSPFRDREGWERMLLQLKKKERVSVVTLLTTYNSMIITDISTRKSSDVGEGSLIFRMVLLESLIAETETGKLPANSLSADASGRSSLVNGGSKQSLVPLNDQQKSILGQLVGLL